MSEAQAVPGRISVVDKRIFNGKADVNALLPLRYPWAYEAYLEGNKHQWLPGDIHLDQDRVDHTRQSYWPDAEQFFSHAAARAEDSRHHLLSVYRATSAPEVRQFFLRLAQEDTVAIMLAQAWGVKYPDSAISTDAVQDINTEAAYLQALLYWVLPKIMTLVEADLLRSNHTLPAQLNKAVGHIVHDVEGEVEFLFTLMRTFIGEAENRNVRQGMSTHLFRASSSAYHAHLNSVVLNILLDTAITPNPKGHRKAENTETKSTLDWD